MGAEYMILVWYRRKWQITQHGRSDGYPTGQGLDVIEFLINSRKIDADSPLRVMPLDLSKINVNNIEALRSALDSDKVYTPGSEEITAFHDEAYRIRQDAGRLEYNKVVYEKSNESDLEAKYHLKVATSCPLMLLCPSLSGHVCAKILDIVAYSTERVPLLLSLEDLVHGMFCDWLYVVDLDDELLEIYEGFEPINASGPRGRFDDKEFMKVEERIRPSLERSYAFDELRRLGPERLSCEMKALEARYVRVADDWDE